MQPVVGDGNEGVSCPAQELHSLALEHCEGYLSKVRETLSQKQVSPWFSPQKKVDSEGESEVRASAVQESCLSFPEAKGSTSAQADKYTHPLPSEA